MKNARSLRKRLMKMPRSALYEKVTDLKNVRNVEVYRIQWTTRSWGIFGGGEALDAGVSL